MIIISKLKLKITSTAIKKIYQLTHKKNNTYLKFRIYIIGGGCNGFQYQFKIDNKIHDNDIILKKEKNIIIDSISIQYLHGGVIDYIENIEGSKFTVSNPNAKTTCSCGSSFSI
ncbi:iron-sulfur cluster insertion protein ErpA [Buchnera aphidicola]|uniref:iron-sulfur cluster insertion protein ErpA n=1 Tax=Buchnera aphidicola TaxID=9 RepID=UPI00346413B1